MKSDKTTPNVPTLRFKEFNDSWYNESLGNICFLSSGSTPSRAKGNNFAGDICWLTSGELKSKWIYNTEEKITKKSQYEYNLTLFPENTLVIAIYGLEAAGIRGTCGILKKPATISQACMAIQPKDNEISSEFLYSWYKKHGNLIGLKYAQGTKQQNLCFDIVKELKVHYPSVVEQHKISAFIDKIDERIEIQNKIIEDLKILKKELCNRVFSKGSAVRLSELIEEVTIRNKSNTCDNVLSVSNKMGFIKQSEQFEDRTIASENKSNYKVVTKGCFAYNPARINVGSIALLSSHSVGIISPMYVCFKAKNVLDSTYLSFYYQSDFFARELQKKLEGSVRQCLTYENMREIIIPYVNVERQREIATALNRFTMLIATEEKCLKALQKQKSYFLNAMFI